VPVRVPARTVTKSPVAGVSKLRMSCIKINLNTGPGWPLVLTLRYGYRCNYMYSKRLASLLEFSPEILGILIRIWEMVFSRRP